MNKYEMRRQITKRNLGALFSELQPRGPEEPFLFGTPVDVRGVTRDPTFAGSANVGACFAV